MKFVFACIVCMVTAVVGLGVFRLWLAREAGEFAAQISQKAEERRMEKGRQKVRDWLTVAAEVEKESKHMRRQSEHLRNTATHTYYMNYWELHRLKPATE